MQIPWATIKKGWKRFLMVAAAATTLVVVGFLWPYWSYRSVDVYVTKTERDDVRKMYMIFTPEEPFILKESGWYLVWDTSVPYGNIKSEHWHTLGVYGFRFAGWNPDWTFYRKVVSVETIDPPSESQLEAAPGG